MAFSAGDKLGPYEILAPIGAGGMGEVYRARDPRLNRDVAIKVSNAQFSERFAREAQAIAALNHPHICQIYDVVISKDAPNYLVMELVEGAPLKGPLSLEKSVEYAGQILDALDAAHKKGITHRDLKPANILVTRQGIKLLDFGLAKQAGPIRESDSTVTQGLTGQGQIVGTLQYMSPEQLQGKDADARSDLFSFGCVLYEMLTGKRAFEGASTASVIAAILEREPAPLNLSPPLERVIKKSLTKDPEERFQTARDLKTALLWAIEPQPDGFVVQPRGRRWIVAVAGALALAGASAWAVTRLAQRAAPIQGALRLEINPPEGGRFVFGAYAGGIALSPDGKTAAFVASVNGTTALWVRPLDGTAARLLPGTEGAAEPFWSPDSKTVAFLAAGKLQRVDLAGGTPLTICGLPGQTLGGAWSEEGYIIVGTLSSGLFRVRAAGGTPSPLTELDTSRNEVSHRWPRVLPGSRFLYLTQSGNAEVSGIYASSLAKPAERVQLAIPSAAVYAPGGDGKNYLLWLRGDALMAQELDVNARKVLEEPRPVADPVSGDRVTGQINATASANGLLLYTSTNALTQLKWFDRTGKPLGALGDPAQYEMFRLSPDGRRVAVSILRQDGADLWLTDVERGVASRFTSRPGVNYYPLWSPDGRNIVFGSGVTAARDLFRKEVNGAGMEELLKRSNERVTAAMDWSRDGRWVLYLEIAAGTQRDLWAMPVTPDGRPVAGAQPKPYLQSAANEWQGRFSPEPNPRWVAYQSDESGRFEVYVSSFPEPRSKTRISTAGGVYPQWGPGGRELFYMSPDNKLMAVSVKLGTDSVEASQPRELFTLPVYDNGLDAPYDVAPDGQRFLVRATPQQQAGQPLTLIVNWPAGLKK
ncbi:MAG TPA: protein kinase [Bryobacteraceae bacterium]|nr:protein kinase [Bryobacteraceae bacterium]